MKKLIFISIASGLALAVIAAIVYDAVHSRKRSSDQPKPVVAQQQQPAAPAAPKPAPVATPKPFFNLETLNESDRRIAQLINQLGAADIQKRADATNTLKQIGKPALPLLQQAANSDDEEISIRSRAIIKHINTASAPQVAQAGQGGMGGMEAIMGLLGGGQGAGGGQAGLGGLDMNAIMGLLGGLQGGGGGAPGGLGGLDLNAIMGLLGGLQGAGGGAGGQQGGLGNLGALMGLLGGMQGAQGQGRAGAQQGALGGIDMNAVLGMLGALQGVQGSQQGRQGGQRPAAGGMDLGAMLGMMQGLQGLQGAQRGGGNNLAGLLGGGGQGQNNAPPANVSADFLGGFGMRLGAGSGGLRVTDVRPGSRAANTGLIVGDIITKANDKPLDDLNDARMIFTTLAPSDPLRLEVTRRGQVLTLVAP